MSGENAVGWHGHVYWRRQPLDHEAYGEVSLRVLELSGGGQGRLGNIEGLFLRLRPKQRP